MAETYQNNEKELSGLKSRVEELDREIVDYVKIIDDRSTYYLNCES